MAELDKSEALRAWTQAALRGADVSDIDFSGIEIRAETAARIGKDAEALIIKILRAELPNGPETFRSVFKNLFTCRTYFSNIKEALSVAGTDSITEAFKRLVVLSPDQKPTGEVVTVGTSGQRIKGEVYQIYNRQNPERGTLLLGKQAFTHLYEMFAGEGAVREKVEKVKKREGEYEKTLKEYLLGEKPEKEKSRSIETWISKEREEFLLKLKAEVDVAQQLLVKLGYIPGGVLPGADRALLENDAGGGLMGWLKREKKNLPPQAQEALEMLLDPYVELEDEYRAMLLQSVFSVAQSLRYVNKTCALADIKSDLDAYKTEYGQLESKHNPLLRVTEVDAPIISHHDLAAIGQSGIIDYRKARNDACLKPHLVEVEEAMAKVASFFKDSDGKFHDDAMGRSVPSRLKEHLYLQKLTRSEAIIGKEEFFVLRDFSEFYRDGKCTSHLTGAYSIRSFEEKLNQVLFVARKIRYAESFLEECKLQNEPLDAPSALVLSLKKDLLPDASARIVHELPDEEIFARYKARSDQAPRISGLKDKVRALQVGLRVDSFTDEEIEHFSSTMKALIPAEVISEDLTKVRWLLGRPLVEEEAFIGLPSPDTRYYTQSEVEAIQKIAAYATTRQQSHPELVDDASIEAEKVLKERFAEFDRGIYILHRVGKDSRKFLVEKYTLSSMAAKGPRYAGGAKTGIDDVVEYLEPESLKNALQRLEEDFIKIDPPYADNPEYKQLANLLNDYGLARVKLLGYNTDGELWRTLPKATEQRPLYIRKRLLEFIEERVKENTRAIGNHFAIGDSKVLFTFQQDFKGRDLFDVAAEDRKRLEGFVVAMKQRNFPTASIEVMEKALEEGVTRESLYQFAWASGERDLVARPARL